MGCDLHGYFFLSYLPLNKWHKTLIILPKNRTSKGFVGGMVGVYSQSLYKSCWTTKRLWKGNVPLWNKIGKVLRFFLWNTLAQEDKNNSPM